MLTPNTRQLGSLEEIWKIYIGGGVQVPANMVSTIRHFKLFEEMGTCIFTSSTVFGSWVEVERVVAGLGELTVSDDFTAEVGVYGVEKAIPVVGSLDFSPNLTKRLIMFLQIFMIFLMILVVLDVGF